MRDDRLLRFSQAQLCRNKKVLLPFKDKNRWEEPCGVSHFGHVGGGGLEGAALFLHSVDAEDTLSA